MVVSNSEELIYRLKHLKNQGVSKEKEYWHDAFAFNYRMTNIQGAIGCAQLESSSEILEKKKNIAKFMMKTHF